MQRQDSDQDGEKDGMDRRFRRREGIGRPGRGIMRAVMQAVEEAIEPPVMHQAVGPIEIGVVQNDNGNQA